jgi:hypothetical protein
VPTPCVLGHLGTDSAESISPTTTIEILYGYSRQGRNGVSEYSTSCINIRANDLLISACVGAVAWHLLARP